MLASHINPATKRLVQPHYSQAATTTKMLRSTLHRANRPTRGFNSKASNSSSVELSYKEVKVSNSRSTTYVARASYASLNMPKSNSKLQAAQVMSISAATLRRQNDPLAQQSKPDFELPVKAYKPAFNELRPPSSGIYGPPPPAPIRFDNTSYITDSELYLDGRSLDEELARYEPFRYNEPDGHYDPAPCAVRQALAEYEKKAVADVYNGFGYNEPDGRLAKKPCTTEEALAEYDRKAGIYNGGFKYNEPDGHFDPAPCSVRQALNEYEQNAEADVYNGFGYQEPDGKPLEVKATSTEEALTEYEKKAPKDIYNGFGYNEPDGKPVEKPSTTEEALAEYEKKAPEDTYSGFGYNEPDGKPVNKTASTEEALADFDKKASYDKPYKHNEPDGLPQETNSTTEEALKEYEEKLANGYNPFGYNEPDGLPVEKPSSVEDALKEFDQQLASLHKPFGFNEPDGKPEEKACAVEEALSEFDQKHNYDKGFAHNEPDGKLPLKADPVRAALSEFDAKFEPKVSINNSFFDEPGAIYPLVLEPKYADSPSALLNHGSSDTTPGTFRSNSVSGASGPSGTKPKVALSQEQIDQIELEASVILNQIGHLRGRVNTILQDLKTGDIRSSSSSSRLRAFSEAPITASSPQEEAAAFSTEDAASSGKHKEGLPKRMLVGAIAGTGVFYGAGVVTEFFTTGGADGTRAVGL